MGEFWSRRDIGGIGGYLKPLGRNWGGLMEDTESFSW